ncbi:tumor necrosis factor ligand superfamily member 12 isoform X2 [Ambystoma mexicanum]|uniref:tumor necrosis factor ligand superfamily member 12 isoform X2 n=1 Tax=Ambystoma mexicanum TaxID=8296 RepID=UPI0037E9A097
MYGYCWIVVLSCAFCLLPSCSRCLQLVFCGRCSCTPEARQPVGSQGPCVPPQCAGGSPARPPQPASAFGLRGLAGALPGEPRTLCMLHREAAVQALCTAGLRPLSKLVRELRWLRERRLAMPLPLPGRRTTAATPRPGLQPVLLLVVSGAALFLASLSLLLAASSWGRSLCLSQALEEGLSRPQPEVHYGPGWNREGFLYRFAQEGKTRQRRTARNKNANRNRKALAAHYEVKSRNDSPQAQAVSKGRVMGDGRPPNPGSPQGPSVLSSWHPIIRHCNHVPLLLLSVYHAYSDHNGIIKDWIEVKLNSTNPLSYNSINGEFKVNKRGLYYLYCQVHFNEGKSIYMKLDIALDGAVAFRCLEEFSTTAASIQEAEVKVCQVSGLVLLQPNSAILIKTIKDVSLKTERYLTYFGLFQVH